MLVRKKLLKASSYCLEDALGLDLNERLEKGKLSFLLLNQPPVCDYHCRRCFMPEYRRQSYSPALSLSIEECRKILKDAKDNGVLCLEISGEGEPLLSKNLPSIIKEANSLGLLTTLITNGNSLTEEKAKFFKKNNVTLVFSLHTLDRKNYESDNCNKGSFEKKIENIELASKIFRDSTEEVNGFEVFRIAVHATLQADNSKEVGKLKSFCKSNGLFFSIAPLAHIGSALNHPEICFKSEKPVDSIVWKGDNSIIHSHSSAKIFGREVCGTAFYGLNIGYDGAILFDCHYGYEVGEKNLLGNIKEISFKEAVERQKHFSKTLFSSIKGACPARDLAGKAFLKKVLDGKIQL